jgi:hypothetical protein
LQIPSTEADYLECPRLATVCPNLFCPASCSGRGICDYDEKSGPKCKCFDPENTSDGCYENAEEDVTFVEDVTALRVAAQDNLQKPQVPQLESVPRSAERKTYNLYCRTRISVLLLVVLWFL